MGESPVSAGFMCELCSVIEPHKRFSLFPKLLSAYAALSCCLQLIPGKSLADSTAQSIATMSLFGPKHHVLPSPFGLGQDL